MCSLSTCRVHIYSSVPLNSPTMPKRMLRLLRMYLIYQHTSPTIDVVFTHSSNIQLWPLLRQML